VELMHRGAAGQGRWETEAPDVLGREPQPIHRSFECLLASKGQLGRFALLRLAAEIGRWAKASTERLRQGLRSGWLRNHQRHPAIGSSTALVRQKQIHPGQCSCLPTKIATRGRESEKVGAGLAAESLARPARLGRSRRGASRNPKLPFDCG